MKVENGTENTKNGQKSTNFFGALKMLLPRRNTVLGERKPWYKISVLRRIIYFILSLALAVFLWGFVLMTQNPDRQKTFTGIKPYFESGSEADLLARNLTVSGDLSEILKDVSVTVSAPLTDISKMDKNSISATISLNDVSKAGWYTLEIRASSAVGTVKRIEPSTISVYIDDIVSRTVPVSYDFRGELPEGYWHDTPVLVSTSTTVEGAKDDVLNVSNAVCHIDLTNLTESVASSYPLSVLDSEGNELDKSVFKKNIPSVTVRMTVLPYKTFDIVEPEIIDEDMPDYLEIAGYSMTEGSIQIAAAADELNAISEIAADQVRLTNITEPGTYFFPLTLNGLPSEYYVLGNTGANSIQLKVDIVDKEGSQMFYDVPIEFIGQNEKYTYNFQHKTINVTVSGPLRLIQGLLKSQIVIEVNVGNKGPGDYDIEIEFSFSDSELYGKLNIMLPLRTVHVIVAEPSEE